jgi:hypothetical protein
VIAIRWAMVAAIGLGMPLLVAQLLPSTNPDRWSPIAVALVVGLGAIAGFGWPGWRAWMALVGWIVASSLLLLLAWTDLVLDVPPSVLPVDQWLIETFGAIVAAISLASVGFGIGALVARRGRVGRVTPGTLVRVALAAGIAISGALLVAVAMSRSPLVLQDDAPTVTIRVTESGIEADPASVGPGEATLVFESTASTPAIVAWPTAIDIGDGRERALTQPEIDAWLIGDWATLGPAFENATISIWLDPGARTYGGRVHLVPSPDGTGGALWYRVAPAGAVSADRGTWPVRAWPGPASGEAAPEPVVWPPDASAVLPVLGP